MAEKKYLDEVGLAEVANHVNTRLKTVTAMPASADAGAVRLYVGENTSNYLKGHIYQYNNNSWQDITSSIAANMIYDNTDSGLDSTNVQDAIDELNENTETGVSGAIALAEEANQKVDNLTASDVVYDNTDSGLTATNVQDVVDELQGEINQLSGGIVPKGTITFNQLPALTDVEIGWMYNISDDFTTTNDFVVPGVSEKAGSNVYCADIGSGVKKWDVFAVVDYSASNIDYDNTDSGLTATNVQSAIDEIEGSLSTVAKTGSYDDLLDKPTIPAAQVNSDWNSSSGVSEILNKPTLGTAAGKDYTTSVIENSGNLVTSGGVKSAIDSAISSVYKPAGNKTCAELVAALLVSTNLGNVYNMTDSGTTTSDFVEGAGKTIEEGDNVVIVDIGSAQLPDYKFDLLSGMVDLSNYIQKSITSGLVKNDGSIDTTSYVTGVKGNGETNYRTGNVNITPTNIGLGSVVNTGDSATPVSGGTTKFTTGGAYTELAKKVDKSDDSAFKYYGSPNGTTKYITITFSESSGVIIVTTGYTSSVIFDGPGGTPFRFAPSSYGVRDYAWGNENKTLYLKISGYRPIAVTLPSIRRTEVGTIGTTGIKVNFSEATTTAPSGVTFLNTVNQIDTVSARNTALSSKQDTLTFSAPLSNSSNTVSISDFTAPASDSANGTKGTVPAPSKDFYKERNITYLSADGWRTPSNVAVCKTAATTVAKEATMTGFQLVVGAHFPLYLYVANTAANATLNVNSKGAKPIKVNGAAVTASNLTVGWYDVVYDGSYYQLYTSGEITIPHRTYYNVNTGVGLGYTANQDVHIKDFVNKLVSTYGGNLEINLTLGWSDANDVNLIFVSTTIDGYMYNSEFYETKSGSTYSNKITPTEGQWYDDVDTGKVYKYTSGAFAKSSTQSITRVSTSGTSIKGYIKSLSNTVTWKDVMLTIVRGNAQYNCLITVSATAGAYTTSLVTLRTGTVLVPNGGTGMTTASYKNAVVIGNSSTVTDAMQTVRTADGAFFATAQDGKPSFGTLPIAQGGTGQTSAQAIVDETIQTGIAPKTDATSDWTDFTEIITTHVNGYSTTNKRLYRRTADKAFNYIKTKLGLGNSATLDTGTTSGTVATGNHTHTLTLAADSGTSAITLAHNTKYKLTAGGNSVIFTTPTDSNTDTKVTQNNSTTDADYRVLLSYGATNDAQTNTVNKSSKLLFNPSSGNLTTTKTSIGDGCATIQYNSTTQAIDFVFN